MFYTLSFQNFFMDSQLWTEKYFPSNLPEFIGNSEVVEKAISWSREWKKGKKEKPLLLYGPTGTGKTALAYLLAKINKWGIFELNASDFRTKEIIEKVAGGAALNASFSGELRLVLLDEIDGLQSQDRGGMAAIVQIIKQSQHPIILTANDIYSDKKLLPLRSLCSLLQFKRINYLSIAKRLREILEQEKISFEPEAITELAKLSSGDFRSALLDAQTLSLKGNISSENVKELGYREREEDIFKILRKIFNATSVSEARNAKFSSDLGDELIFRWIEENIPRHYTEPNDTANAFERLSRADIFNGRIRKRQHFGFLRYSSDLMSAGVALAKEKPYHSFVPYQFPKLLSSLSKSASIRATKGNIAEKLSKQVHSSMNEIIAEDMPFLKMLFEKKEYAVSLSAQFDFTEEEIAFMLSSKPETKKVKEIFKDSQEIRKKNIAISSKRRFEAFRAFEREEKEAEKEENPNPLVQEEQTTLF